MEPPGRYAAGAARGPAEMETPGGSAASGLPAGPARFRCPENFCARRLAPGAAFCLGAPGKRLLLIRAPADFRPESLSGHRLALLGSPLLRASQPDGSQKVYGLRATREESVARLLIAAGRPERLMCAQPFGGSLRIQERDGAADAPRPLFPVPERPPPKVPAGLKQRFFPFGARLPSSGAPPRKAARERGKKRPLLPWKQEGPEQLLGGSPEPAEPLLGMAGSKQRPLKEAEEPAAAAAPGPATLPALGGRLLWQDARPSGHLEEASWSGEAEEPGRRAGKKAKKRKTRLETEELPNPSSRYWQPEWELRLQGGREPEKGGCKATETEMPEAGAEGLWGAAATKEEPGDAPCLGSLPEENPRGTGEDPAGEPPSGKKEKKKRRRRSRERVAEGLWGAAAIKEEPGDVPRPGSLPDKGLGSPREEPAGYIKQSPGKGAGGLRGVGALKEEPGDTPSLGSLAEESLGVTPEDPAGEPPSGKKEKKRRRRSRERVAEGLWGAAAIKEEPGDVPCPGSLPDKGLGSPREEPAGYIKQSPGKGAGGLRGVGALKEEPGDAPSLGSLAEESLGVTPEDPAGEPPSGKKEKKKKRRRSRERAAEGLWGAAATKEELGGSCLGHLPEEHLGPAGELLACQKEKLDKEPLREQGTETQQRLASNVLDWAAPLWQEAEGLEEPRQRNRAAPRPKKKGRRREREDQVRLFAAGT